MVIQRRWDLASPYKTMDFSLKRACFDSIFIGVILVFLSCNINGYNDLGEPVNRFAQIGTDATTYLRVYKTGSESIVELFIFENSEDMNGHCMFITITDNTQNVITDEKIGNYKIKSHRLTLNYFIEYINISHEKTNPARVGGAVQNSLSLPDLEYTYESDSNSGILKINGESYFRLDNVFDSVLMNQTALSADQFFKLYLLSNMAAHCRIKGFGGAGMLQYIGKTTQFDGLLSGYLALKVNGLRNVTSQFTYSNHTDLSGITLNGQMTNESDMNGNGTMSGSVHFIIQGSSKTWQGVVEYSDIQITHTLPSGGFYGLTIDSSYYQIDYNDGNPGDFDLTDIFTSYSDPYY